MAQAAATPPKEKVSISRGSSGVRCWSTAAMIFSAEPRHFCRVKRGLPWMR